MFEFNDILLRQFRIDLIEGERKPLNSFLKLKYNYDYSDICYIVDNLGEKNKTYLEYIYGNSIPKSIAELGDSKLLYSDSKDGFEKEINWSLLAIRKFSLEIQFFIDEKIKYEKAFINGDYETATKSLGKIEENVCFSLWGIEQRFLLIEIQKGLKENTAYLNEINEKNKKWFIKRFSHFFSLKAEKELSVNQYNMSLARLLFRYIKTDNQVDLHYYNFKLNFLENENQTLLPDFLAIEGFHSIVDKYLSLIRFLQLAILENNKDQKEFLDSRLFYLSKKVNDENINKLRLLINTTFLFEFVKSEKDVEAILALDSFTNDKLEISEKRLYKCLNSQPLSIELYEVYIKTIILLSRPLKIIGNNQNSFQNKILKAMFDVLSRNEDTLESLNEIRKIAYNLSSFSTISFYLMNFYKEKVDDTNVFKDLSILNTNFINPTFIHKLKNECSEKLLPFEYINSNSLNYINLLENGNLSLIEKSNLPQNRKRILQAHYYQKANEYKKAIDLWGEILNQPEVKDYQKTKILQNLFLCREALGQFDDCIDLYVDYYFLNPLLVSNIKVDNIKVKIKTAKYKNIKHTINLPIFYKLINSEDYDIHIAYECFIINKNSYTPEEFINNSNINNLNKNKLIFFLNDICTLDIFKHSPFITSSKQKYNERILVCTFLATLDENDKEDYNNEIERLTKRLIIQKGIQELDESKIYVNQTGIIESEIKNIESIFNRFKMIGELKSEKDISILSLYSDKMLTFKFSDDEDGSEISKDPQFDIYKDIFYFIRDKFLFSNYGLQQYLSARIRHGVLLGEIRPEFEALNLITEKEKGIDSYKDNENWGIFTSQLTDKGIVKFQGVFSEFSSNVDDLINEEILSKSLQIKIEDKNTEGWLDYNFDDLVLQLHYVKDKKIKNTEPFINSIFEVLWERTEKNLDGVKLKINGGIRDSFFKLLLNLEQDLIIIFGSIPEQIENHINEARVNIENKLIKVANWFSITESNISDFKMDKIVDVSLEYNRTINPIRSINCDCVLKGSYYPSLVDLFRIFMNNANKHSGFEGINVDFFITIVQTENQLKIQFKNPLDDSIDKESLKKKINSFSFDLNKSMKEDRSGFHKAIRIIKSDLFNKNNNMYLIIDDENRFCVNIVLDKKIMLS